MQIEKEINQLSYLFFQLMRDLPNVGEKNKEKPFCIPYSVKARTLIYAHINRMELPPKTLEQGKTVFKQILLLLLYCFYVIKNFYVCHTLSLTSVVYISDMLSNFYSFKAINKKTKEH